MRANLAVFAVLVIALMIISARAAAADSVAVDLSVKEGTPRVSLLDVRLVGQHEATSFLPLSVQTNPNTTLEVIKDGASLGKIEYNYITTSADLPTKSSAIFSLYFNNDTAIGDIKLIQSGNTLVDLSVANVLCNNNGKCENCLGASCKNHFESYLSCPKDCKISNSDGVCSPAKDGFCDPDCPRGVDPDCSSWQSIAIFIGLVAASLAVVIFLAVMIMKYLKSRTPNYYPRAGRTRF